MIYFYCCYSHPYLGLRNIISVSHRYHSHPGLQSAHVTRLDVGPRSQLSPSKQRTLNYRRARFGVLGLKQRCGVGKNHKGCFKHASWGRSLTKCGCSASSLMVQCPFAVPLALAVTNKLIDSAWLSRVLSTVLNLSCN